MTNNNISIKKINDLLEYKLIGSKLTGYNFFIPSYQRGYRWTEQQVKDLLNDIDEFSPKEVPNSNEKTWYCLQPIVLKQKGENEWEVIDGQQRLTTIYLILHYLNQGYVENRRKKIFDLNYETREKSASYLKNDLDEKKIDDTNIDYYFISSAYKIICDWFKEKGQSYDINKFESKFNFSTKVIWYETSPDEDSIDIFTRINSGKIPLTNAELIKALFLNSSNFANADNEKLRLKQLEIASEWDRMEYALQDDAFWYFVNKKSNSSPTHIEFIFDLMVSNEIQSDEFSTFHFFNKKFKNHSEEKNDSEELINYNWLEIKKIFQTLEEWYTDRELYHKIGFLISTGITIKDILEGKKEQTKTEFKNWLKNKISEQVPENIDELEYRNENIRNILLLHNIQTMLDNDKETSRFPFDRYKKEFWDIEHIHAIETDVKVNAEEQAKWLENNFIETDEHQDQDKNELIDSIISSKIPIGEEEFKEIIYYVSGERDDNIQNLCLLDSGTNRSYKNDSFKVKRRKIIQREIAGTFIPICTKNVFMKYYSTDVKDLELWNENDKTDYVDKMKRVIAPYLPEEVKEENEQ